MSQRPSVPEPEHEAAAKADRNKNYRTIAVGLASAAGLSAAAAFLVFMLYAGMTGGLDQASENISDKTNNVVNGFTTYFIDKIDSESARSLEECNIALESTRQKMERLKALDADLARNPDNRKQRRIRAIVYTGLSLHSRALADFDILLKATPQSEKLQLKRADCLEMLNDDKAALLACDDLVKLQPASSSHLIRRAKIRFKLNDLRGARADLEKAIKNEDDEKQDAQVELAKEQFAAGDRAAAIKMLSEMRKSYLADRADNPDDPPYFSMAQSNCLNYLTSMLVIQGEYDRALKLLRELEKEEKNDDYLETPAAARKMASLQAFMATRKVASSSDSSLPSTDGSKEHSALVKEIHDILREAPPERLPNHSLSLLIEKSDLLGDRAGAARYRKIYLAKLNDEIRLYPQLPGNYHDLAVYYSDNNQNDEALEYFEKAGKLAPSDSDIWRHRVETLTALHQNEKAYTLAKAACERFVDDRLLIELARCQLNLAGSDAGSDNGAGKTLDRALLLNFDNSVAYELRAELQRKKKNATGAALDDFLASYLNNSSD